MDAKEVAFKAFKVAYDRESVCGYRVSGDEFKVDCTKFDKLVMVFKDGHYKVVELPEKMFVGPIFSTARCRSANAFSRSFIRIAKRPTSSASRLAGRS